MHLLSLTSVWSAFSCSPRGWLMCPSYSNRWLRSGCCFLLQNTHCRLLLLCRFLVSARACLSRSFDSSRMIATSWHIIRPPCGLWNSEKLSRKSISFQTKYIGLLWPFKVWKKWKKEMLEIEDEWENWRTRRNGNSESKRHTHHENVRWRAQGKLEPRDVCGWRKTSKCCPLWPSRCFPMWSTMFTVLGGFWQLQKKERSCIPRKFFSHILPFLASCTISDYMFGIRFQKWSKCVTSWSFQCNLQNCLRTNRTKLLDTNSLVCDFFVHERDHFQINPPSNPIWFNIPFLLCKQDWIDVFNKENPFHSLFFADSVVLNLNSTDEKENPSETFVRSGA